MGLNLLLANFCLHLSQMLPEAFACGLLPHICTRNFQQQTCLMFHKPEVLCIPRFFYQLSMLTLPETSASIFPPSTRTSGMLFLSLRCASFRCFGSLMSFKAMKSPKVGDPTNEPPGLKSLNAMTQRAIAITVRIVLLMLSIKLPFG